MQSRYYNPEIGRFINADALVSTGQGLLGNNMFAYCLNNPVAYNDRQGTVAKICLTADADDDDEPWRDHSPGGGGIDLAYAALAATAVVVVIGAGIAQITYQQNKKPGLEAYEYQQVLKQEQVFTKRKFPHVHHIVPVGNFSNRSIEVQAQITEMHSILRRNGVDRFIDPMNLMLVSAKIHASLHTDAYISHVYSYIKQAERSREAIYAALFYLRIEIAALDTAAVGY